MLSVISNNYQINWFATTELKTCSAFGGWTWEFALAFSSVPIYLDGVYTSNGHGFVLRPNNFSTTGVTWATDTYAAQVNPQTYARFIAIGY